MNVPPIRLIGPGDITALDARAVVRTEPRDGVDAFEPNYMASVELALPDLPWMFTPSAPVNGRLKPWICLIVVPDTVGANITPYAGGIDVLHLDAPLDPANELPDLGTIDFWAHAQVAGSETTEAALNAAFNGDPSRTVSRLIAPRKLDAGQAYIACIVPTYRAGVNAALGLTVDDHDLAPAWDATATAPFFLPVYYSFRFRTGPDGDFASLASKVRPPQSPIDAGTRAMDVTQPGFGAAPAPGVSLGLEGALRTVGNSSTPWPAGAQAAYEAQLRHALAPPQAADPVLTPPTYGRAQSGASLPAASSPPLWLGELNLDPRTRTAASTGAQVVQRDQETLVASSWDQWGEIRKANQLLRQAQLARQVSASLNQRHLAAVAGDGTYLQITAPLHKRVRVSLNGVTATLRGHIDASRLPSGAVSPALRKMARPRGPIGRQLTAGVPTLVDRLNQPTGATGALQTAGPVRPPRGMVALDAISPTVQVKSMTGAVLAQAQGWKVVAVEQPPAQPTTKPAVPPAATLHSSAPLEPAATSEPAAPGPVSGADLVHSTQAAAPLPVAPLVDWSVNPNLPDIMKGQRANLPPAIEFPPDQAKLAVMTEQFRAAATSIGGYLNTAPSPPPDPPPLGGSPALAPARAQLTARLDPESTIRTRIGARILLDSGADPLQPMRAGPSFPQPMYAALAQLSPEWILPGVSSLPQDCATLLATNSRFVESFLVGLNEELARELLWREFPVQANATYFQNFWGASAPDIPPISSFDPNGHLGDHTVDHASGTRIVLLIRATLFQRYPNAVVSAIQAAWSNQVRILTDTRQYPLFRGQIGADITFFGFDIDDPQGSSDPAAGKPGWYFVLEEHPTEPRFGLEPEKRSVQSGAWNDLSWQEVTLTGAFLDVSPAPAPAQRESVTWGANAASMAYILLRQPVRVALHAQALLGPKSAGAAST